MHERNDDTPRQYLSVGKMCQLSRHAQRAWIPKVSEFRQNGVISMNHLNWHAHAAIRDFV